MAPTPRDQQFEESINEPFSRNKQNRRGKFMFLQKHREEALDYKVQRK